MIGDTWQVVSHSFQVASIATLVVLGPATGVGYFLARTRFPGHTCVAALVSLPLVLPPTAVGYLLVRMLAVEGPLGSETLGFDLGLLLSWRGAVLASALMAFPLVARTARSTFEAIDPRLESMSQSLGETRIRTFFRITLPLASRGLGAAGILGFARALGEFGATILVAGNIEGETETLASAIFVAQQSGQSERAFELMALALILGYLAILASEALIRNKSQEAGR